MIPNPLKLCSRSSARHERRAQAVESKAGTQLLLLALASVLALLLQRQQPLPPPPPPASGEIPWAPHQ